MHFCCIGEGDGWQCAHYVWEMERTIRASGGRLWSDLNVPRQRVFAGNTPDDDQQIVIERSNKTARPRRWQVVYHNDDYTTRDFVVESLKRFFDKDESEATFIMLSVHHKGQGVAGVYPKDIAETKVYQVTQYARAKGMPLLVTAEPFEAGDAP